MKRDITKVLCKHFFVNLSQNTWGHIGSHDQFHSGENGGLCLDGGGLSSVKIWQVAILIEQCVAMKSQTILLCYHFKSITFILQTRKHSN